MALITAPIALGVGVWENAQMRAHNRLSVTPRLQLTAEFRNSEADAVDQGVIRLTNEGVGPAVVGRVEIGPDVMVGEERTIELAILEKPSMADEPLFPSFLKQVDLRISYRSVYGERFETDLRRQRFLARL